MCSLKSMIIHAVVSFGRGLLLRQATNREANSLLSASSPGGLVSWQHCSKASMPVIHRGTGMPCL